MSKRQALGRGLGAYFPNMNDETETNTGNEVKNPFIDTKDPVNTIIHIPVQHIRANPNQPRKEFDELRLQELSDSIQQHGLIQPITVRHLGSSRFELISGERRLRASKMAGQETIPAYVREVSDNDSIALALIENVQREDLNAIEVALGYQQLIDECSLTQEEVAKKVGKNRSTVTNMLRLLNLPAFIQAALKQGKISTGHARSLLSLDDEKAQQLLLAKAIEEDFSVRQMEDAVRKLQEAGSKSKSKAKPGKDEYSIHLEAISKRLRSKLSTKVELKRKNEGGEIRIEYYSQDELERLLQLFEAISD
ncbi:ParB/RepB/Spo0J family partition protein [bacterium]|nr:MAG: ParB/RepB/Spo0J family partition protein [bacterium]